MESVAKPRCQKEAYSLQKHLVNLKMDRALLRDTPWMKEQQMELEKRIQSEHTASMESSLMNYGRNTVLCGIAKLEPTCGWSLRLVGVYVGVVGDLMNALMNFFI
mmetsp:Transcript_14517/g.35098  ORF Transcript_14517/g.35098 Transcript_14517/m.35098 type:complete len:105 (-) Transcript_14517:9-323(-)